jgi:RND family efflux transporter MFP subunit
LRGVVTSVLSIILVLLGGVGISGCDKTPEQSEPVPKLVKAIRVADPGAMTKRIFPGRASAAREVNLSFRVAGPVVEKPVKIGDVVKEGDILARIDPRDYEVQIETVGGQLERARAQLRVAELEYQRALDVSKKGQGLISQSEVDTREGARDAARASVASLESTLTTAKDNLAYTVLKAPFDGVVVSTFVDSFEDVLAKQPVVRLLDPERVEMTLSVPESLIGYARFVDRIAVQFDALPGVEVEATIKEVGREASVATRTYPVTIEMTQPDQGEILPGMAGKAKVISKLPDSARETGIEIPLTALFTLTGSDSSYVWVIDEASMSLKRQEVQPGMMSRYGVLIREGIAPGDWVVTAGVHSLEEGRKVRVLDEANES